MGNVSAGQAPVGDLQSSLQHLPLLLSHMDDMGGTKVLKSMRCLYNQGSVVVKVYQMRRKQEDLDAMKREIDTLRRTSEGVGDGKHGNGSTDSPSVLPYQISFIAPNHGFVLRPYIAQNLADRFHIHPFLTLLEKKWIAFQCLEGLVQLHDKGIIHKGISSDNVLLTSWDWVLLSDAAFYKPDTIHVDNLGDFSTFYESHKSRRCYIAPERFVHTNEAKCDVTSACDLFSMGCVLAEIFLDGQPLFDYPQLLRYKDGSWDPKPMLAKITDFKVREMIAHMIQHDPKQRKTAAEYVSAYTDVVFPPSFKALFQFFKTLMASEYKTADAKMEYIRNKYPDLMHSVLDHDSALQKQKQAHRKSLKGLEHSQPVGVALSHHLNATTQKDKPKSSFGTDLELSRSYTTVQLRENSEAMSEKLSSLSQRLNSDSVSDSGRMGDVSSPSTEPRSSKSFSFKMRGSDTANRPFSMKHKEQDRMSLVYLKQTARKTITSSFEKQPMIPHNVSAPPLSAISEELVPLVTLLCSLLRNIRASTLKLQAIELLHELGQFIPSSLRLQRVVPYTIALITDFHNTPSLVRSSSILLLADTLDTIEMVPPSDADTFLDYVFPSLSGLPSDQDELVRMAYALKAAQLADTSRRFLDLSNYFRKHDPNTKKEFSPLYASHYDRDLARLRDHVWSIVTDTINSSNSRVKIALLTDITRLGMFFGREMVNAKLLPLLITVLNDRDWELRAEFFEYIIGIAAFVGQVSLQDFILPCIEHALYDNEEYVVLRALESLTALCEMDLFENRIADELAGKVAPLLCHASTWIRRATVKFVVSIADALGPAKAFCFLCPRIRHFLQEELYTVTTASLAQCLKPPLRRDLFQQELRRCEAHMTVSKRQPPEETPVEDEVQEELMGVMRPYIEGVAAKTIQRSDRAAEHKEFIELYWTASRRFQLNSVPIAEAASAQQDALRRRDYESTTQALNHQALFKGRRRAASVFRMSVEKALFNRLRDEPNFIPGPEAKPEAPTTIGELGPETRAALCIPHDLPAMGQAQLRTEWLSSASFYRNHGPPFASAGNDPLLDSWRPTGTLVSNLTQHTQRVNALAVAHDNMFVASCSDDGTVLLWDTQRLCRSVYASAQLCYRGQQGRILDVTLCDGTHSFASASSDGSVHVSRVDYAVNYDGSAKQYTGSSLVKQLQDNEGAALAIRQMNALHETLLVYATQEGSCHSWDLRSRREPWSLFTPSYVGAPTVLHTGPSEHALIVGTTRGFVLVWDLRFRMIVQMWRHSSGGAISSIDSTTASTVMPASSPYQHPQTGPLLFVCASGSNEVAAFDMYTSEVRHVMSAPSPTFGAPPPPKPKQDHINYDAMGIPGMFSYLGAEGIPQVFPSEFNDIPSSFAAMQYDQPRMTGTLCHATKFMITAGYDAVVRFWDLERPERSYRISGEEAHTQAMYTAHAEYNAVVLREEAIDERHSKQPRGPVPASTAHRDAITDLKCIEYPQKMLVSSSRDGTIKVWV